MSASTVISQPLIALYFFALGGLALYGLHRVWLLFCWIKVRRGSGSACQSAPQLIKYPSVTVQLPIYNERFVAGRLLDAVAGLNWPTDRLEIQVLDDSTDDTQLIIDERISYWSQKGVCIQVIRRNCREGFKAGALKMGINMAKGELIAVFDADFLPPPDFLIRTTPCFSDPKVGLVQCRWGFINAEQSWFTRIQALLLSTHFGIEHLVRFRRGLFFNFNGTAGIWRKTAIDSAGGWQSDTVTEDLDLSYRAQIEGWRFVYMNDLFVPSELPVTLSGFRCQQQRWAKGSIQTARKILPLVLKSRSLTLAQKIEAAFHLLANMGWLLGTLITLALWPVIFWRMGMGPYQFLRLDLPLLLCGSGAILLYFYLFAFSQKDRGVISWLFVLPVLAVGLAPSLAVSVMDGMWHKGGEFERTPKFGCRAKAHSSNSAQYYRQKKVIYLMMNFCFLVYTILPLIFSWQRGTWLALPFLTIFPFGFFIVIIKEMRELGRFVILTR
jgi:cellulose synthase/poly-beta-1,6-N-acetylglucosamine synthase-like glycosyltransferase